MPLSLLEKISSSHICISLLCEWWDPPSCQCMHYDSISILIKMHSCESLCLSTFSVGFYFSNISLSPSVLWLMIGSRFPCLYFFFCPIPAVVETLDFFCKSSCVQVTTFQIWSPLWFFSQNEQKTKQKAVKFIILKFSEDFAQNYLMGL